MVIANSVPLVLESTFSDIVYALHRQSSRIGTHLVALHLCEIVLVSFATWCFFETVVFDAACGGSNITKDTIIYV